MNYNEKRVSNSSIVIALSPEVAGSSQFIWYLIMPGLDYEELLNTKTKILL